MERPTKQNLCNIQRIFEEKTGTSLAAGHNGGISGRKLCLAALAAAFCLALASCAYVLFTPLKGDALSLRGSYENGVVTVTVVNGSEKNLRFQEQLKLMSWSEGEILPSGGEAVFENTVFPPHSSGTMTIDLSHAYPMAELEQTFAPNDLYLVLTNNDFAFGHDWSCSFLLTQAVPETNVPAPVRPSAQYRMEGIDESLAFYFADHYLDEIPAFNTANTAYMQAVQALLSKQNGIQIQSVDPLLVLEEPEPGVIFDETIPEAAQAQLILTHYSYLDSFNRMVSSVFPAEGMGTAKTLGVSLPQYQGQTDGGIGDFRLLYFFVFPTPDIQQPDAYAFLYGHVLSFPEMEAYQVYADQQYTIYDMTDLFYTDLDAYIDDFLNCYGGSVYCDDQVRQRIHNVYHYYRDQENLHFSYPIVP